MMYMVGMEPKRLEGVIRDYIIHLKQDKKRSQGTVSAYISAIRSFLRYERYRPTLEKDSQVQG